MPVDENLKEFWIDFNLGSQSISFYFCLANDQAQEGQWDTLCIGENEIHSYTVEEEKDVKVLQLVMTEPICMSGIEGSRLTVHFSSSLDILEATRKVYGDAKNKKFVGKTTTSVVKTTVQIILDEGCSQVLFPESQPCSEPLDKTVSASVRNSAPFQSLSYHEKDPQRCNQQTVTPLRCKMSESCMYVSGSAGRKLGRSSFSCVMPATTPAGKAMVKPALKMVSSSERTKDKLREIFLARSLDKVPFVSEEKANNKKEASLHLQAADIPQDKKFQEVERHRRHIPVEKVLEMVQEVKEQPLESSIVPDSQPALRKETYVLPALCHSAKKRISVSGSLLPYQQSELSAPVTISTELLQQPSSAKRGSGALTHKELHAQLTQRLEEMLKQQNEQGEQCILIQNSSSSMEQHMSKGRDTDKGPGPKKGSMRLAPAKTALSRQAKNNAGASNRDTKTIKNANSIVKQISHHYKSTTVMKAGPEITPFNITPTKRYLFNKCWYPASAMKKPAKNSENLKSCNQSKMSLGCQNGDVFEFSLDVPEHTEKKCRKSSKTSGMDSSVLSNSLTLSNSAKKHHIAKPNSRYVKKHLFSDTDAESTTEFSWLKSANRRPKPKVADYTRQPVKSTLPAAETTFETPNIPTSPKVTKELPKLKRVRQEEILQNKKDKEEKKKNTDKDKIRQVQQKGKMRQNIASRKPTGRPRRNAAQIKSYKELSDSASLSETDEPPPAKKLIIKQAEKPQKRNSVQTREQEENKYKTSSEVAYEQNGKENNPSKSSHKIIRQKAERKLSSPEQPKRKNNIPAFMSSKGHEELWASFTSEENNAALPISSLIPLDPSFRKVPEKTQKKSSDQATRQAEKIILIDGTEEPEKETKQPAETSTHSDTHNKSMKKKENGKRSDSVLSKSIKTSAFQESSKEDRESWAMKLTSLCHSPSSAEKMRSAEKCGDLTKSPFSPIQIQRLSPVAAASPPIDPPSHLKGIQASSFYKTSTNRVKHPLIPAIKKQSAADECLDADLSPVLSLVQPIITSTGRERFSHSSLSNSPDLEDGLKGFLSAANHRSLHASFDKESVISLVTLSQSSLGSVNSIAVICTNSEKTPKQTQGRMAEDTEFQSGPATCQKQQNSGSFSEIDGSEEEDAETQAMSSELAIKMKPRKLFKPYNKPLGSKPHKRDLSSSSEEEEAEEKGVEKRRPTAVKKKNSHISASPSTTAVEDVEMCSTVVSGCWEASVEADTDQPQSEISTSQELGIVCRKFSTEIKRKLENHSRRMDLFTRQSIKAYKQHLSSVNVQVHKYRSQKLEKVKRVLIDEIKNLEQDDTALQNMEEELNNYWKKQALAFHTYKERGTQRLCNLKSTIETNVCHSLEYEEHIVSSEMCLMKKDIKSVQDHLFRQMQEEDLLSVRRGLQALYLPDVPMF
ncbi:synaptonemal complex protein 2 isoform X2 [Hoplias malabaricus]